MAKAKSVFKPLITGVTPVFRPAQVADKAYAKGDPITIVHTFIVEGHHLRKVTKDNIDLGNFTHGYRWKVLDAETLDPCHILVHASLECLKKTRSTTGAGSGDLTVTVSPPPPPPPPPAASVKKGTKAGEDVTVENAFTVFYLDDPAV